MIISINSFGSLLASIVGGGLFLSYLFFGCIWLFRLFHKLSIVKFLLIFGIFAAGSMFVEQGTFSIWFRLFSSLSIGNNLLILRNAAGIELISLKQDNVKRVGIIQQTVTGRYFGTSKIEYRIAIETRAGKTYFSASIPIKELQIVSGQLNSMKNIETNTNFDQSNYNNLNSTILVGQTIRWIGLATAIILATVFGFANKSDQFT